MKISVPWLTSWCALPTEWNTDRLIVALNDLGLEVESVSEGVLGEVIELDLTPNRGDCLSILGTARDTACVSGSTLNWPKEFGAIAGETPPKDIEEHLGAPTLHKGLANPPQVLADAADVAPVFLTREVQFPAGCKSPKWLTDRLIDCGLRPLSLPVDITNYVMLELGQPMHAFDRDSVSEGLVVHLGKEGDSLTLLDSKTVTLRATDIVISDAKGVLSLAGVMGGVSSAVSDGTQRVILEAAHFVPNAIAKTARTNQISSDASHRFERGVSAELPALALGRAVQLFKAVCDTNAGSETVLFSQIQGQRSAPSLPSVTLNWKLLSARLGINFAEPRRAELHRSFAKLGLHSKSDAAEDTWLCTVPSWRFDVKDEEDLHEEVMRLTGYANLLSNSSKQASIPVSNGRGNTDLWSMRFALRRWHKELRYSLAQNGWHECVHYAFAGETPHNASAAVKILNPMSVEMSQMRMSLLPKLISTATHNRRHHLNTASDGLKLFELGVCFDRYAKSAVYAREKKSISENTNLAGVWLPVEPGQQSWQNPYGTNVASIATHRLYKFQFNLEKLFGHSTLHGLRPSDYPVKDEVTLHHFQEYGRQVKRSIVVSPTDTSKFLEVYFTDISGDVARHTGLPVGTILFEVRLTAQHYLPVTATALLEAPKTLKAIPKFPRVYKDLAIIVDTNVRWNDVLETILSVNDDTLENCNLFDCYAGGSLPQGKVSLAFTLMWQPLDKTWESHEIHDRLVRVVDVLQKDLGATLRGSLTP